jgi:hypothetical protein
MGKIQRWILPAALLIFSGTAIVRAQETRQVENPMRIILDAKNIAIYNKDQIVLRYRYDDVPFKPYAQELYTPGGINILRDAPHDHLHHHALMYAVTVDGVNFWEEQQASGRQAHKSLGENKIGKRDDIARAGFTEKIDWLNPRTKEVLLMEERTIEAAVMTEEGATLVNWTARFSLPEGKESVTIGGAHYHGLGMRFPESMDKDKEGKFFNASGEAGKVYRGDERLVRANWCAYSARAEGKPVTIAMFDHPDNLRHPATWFTMKKPFAYLSATMEVYNKPYVLMGQGELVLRYGVIVWDGTTGPNKIEKTYKNWVSTYSQVKKDTDKKENNHDEGKSKQ